MSEPISEELLSAYVDGELSPQLRAAVERWVENSPEARQKLEDFRSLSRLFGDLPRTEVPAEFPTEVLHLAERRMLLPEAAAASGRRRMRVWVLALAAPITAAAALLLILKISNENDRADRGRATVVDKAATSRAGSRSGGLDDGSTLAGNGGQPNVLVARNEPQSGSSDRPAAERVEGALPPSAAPMPSAGVAGGSGGNSGTGSAGTAKSKVALVAPGGPLTPSGDSDQQLQAINDAVEDIRESGAGDKVLLVVRVVVDRVDGMILLQGDFAANDIRIESGAATPGKGANEPKPRDEASYEGLYVEADADAVIASFKTTLARQNPGLRVFVEQSIELAALDVESQKLFLFGDVEKPAGEHGRGDDVAKESTDASEGAKSAPSRFTPAAGSDKSSKADDADAKTNKKSMPAVGQRKSSPSTSNSRTTQPSGPGNRTIEKSASAPVPSDKNSAEKDSQAVPEANQIANNARQMVVPVVPEAIQNRPRSNSASNSQATRNSARSPKQESQKAPDDAKSGDEKPVAQANEKMDEPSPALVRMLIVIEREPQRPEAPAAKKGPSGGAS